MRTLSSSAAGQPATAPEEHPVWREIAPEFRRSEFRHPERMDPDFLRALVRARRNAGVPFRVISDHRPPARNRRAGGARGSAHLEDPCRAVDLWVESNLERFRVIEALLNEGFTRIGIYPARADGSGSIHVDASHVKPSPRIWTRH
jgi:uncharacterized protein YcbK (DUF882 family)